jgi:protein tyrosine/serine phosphatase
MSFEPRPPCNAREAPVLNSLRPDEERYARRMARIARWDRPIESRGQRLRAWANMLLVDHGIFRLAYLNAHKVTPRLWRAAQPAPGQIAWFARQGVKTIVNLRGGREHGAWPLQREACERHGIELVEFVLRSRGAPERETILAAQDFFASLKEPALVHCKSGADRAGFFAALYLLIHEGRPLAEAMRQLSLRYGHFRFAKTGILDAFFETYRVEGEAKGIAFLDWARDIYDPARLEAEFKPGFFSSLLADWLIRRE